MDVQDIDIKKIKLSKNSRLTMQNTDLTDLMSSIKQNGLLQPIGVVKTKLGFEVCYGNRRFIAMSKLGYSFVPAIVQDGTDATSVDIKNLTENIQRRNISLTEAGRYIAILMSQGLKMTEVSTRLGVTKSYVTSCVDAFRSVPEEYRNDLEMRVGSAKPTPGKISMSAARAIISAQKSVRINKDEMAKMFEAAKTSDSFKPENAKKYAQSIKRGHKNFLKDVQPLRHVVVKVFMKEDEYERIYDRYVTNGQYRGLSRLFGDVLAGKTAVRMKLEDI